MRNPIKERVLVLQLKGLSPDNYVRASENIRKLVLERLSGYSFEEKTLKIPQVRRPKRTIDGKEPDWSELRLSVKRICIFEDRQNQILIQLSNEFLSVNSITGKDDDLGAGSFECLFKFYKAFVSALNDYDVRFLKPESLRSQVLYVFDREALAPFVTDVDNRGYPNYLDIRRFLQPGIIPKIDVIEMCPPLDMNANYQVKRPEGGYVGIEVAIDIEYKRREQYEGWEFMFDLTIEAPRKLDDRNRWGVEDLQDMDTIASDCLPRFFLEDALDLWGLKI